MEWVAPSAEGLGRKPGTGTSVLEPLGFGDGNDLSINNSCLSLAQRRREVPSVTVAALGGATYGPGPAGSSADKCSASETKTHCQTGQIAAADAAGL
jgi:hypothetical protein